MHPSRLLVIAPTTLLLLAPLGSAQAADAATANPWSAYYPAAGVTCTSTAPQADGTAKTVTETVLKKTATTIVTRVTGQGRTTSRLLAGGRLRQTMAFSERANGMRIHAAASATYPSPSVLLHHGRGNAEMTMSLTMPQREARAMLTHGRTLTMTATARIKGLGARTVTLADPAATTVEALGIRTSLGSVKLANVKPAFQHEFTTFMGSAFAEIDETQWIAKGRDVVEDTTGVGGSTVTVKQVSCR